jgi:ABC-2 type transport system permease protein
MRAALTIAIQEWRYWSRTKLAAAVAMLALILIVVSVFATFSQVANEKDTRESMQVKAEHTFRDQPARHPHRMVHYGHYVFRTPTPLAALDPGVDPFTGTVMFLEGHRQNSATFSSSYDGAQAGPFSRLSPALAYQLLVPLVLIIMGFGVVSRERESATDRQLVTSGISPVSIWFGKTLALGSVALLLLLPMLVGVSLSDSEWSIGIGFITLYFLYLMTWVLIITAVSTWSQSTSTSLLILLAFWLVLCALMPRLLASAANTAVPNASQIETDMDVIMALRSFGDGHNANDPAFNRLKANLLDEYDVATVEDLPVNFRGVVAQAAEADLTNILNEFAESRMKDQRTQTQLVKSYEFISPFIVLQSASMVAAGTNGGTHHRFLREAENVRFEFVQGLNKAHEQKMSYADDINRSSDTSAERRTRVSTENWKVLNDFRFEADPADVRLKRLLSSYAIILAWMIIFTLAGFIGARRLPEVDHG